MTHVARKVIREGSAQTAIRRIRTVLAKRLDFETALLKDIRRDGRPRATVKLRWVVGLFAIGAALAASASALLTLFSGNSHAPIAETATSFVLRVAGQEMEAAAEFCPEGALGSQLVAAERGRVFRPDALVLPQTGPAALAERVAQLKRVHDDLERAGLNWSNARALAFGGVLAKAHDPSRMQGTATVAVGNIYISDGRGVFAVEVSLMNCLGTYVITDIWVWGALEIVPEALKSHSRAQFDEFKGEKPDDGVVVKAPEHVFVKS